MEVRFLCSLGVLCLAADGRWAVNRSDSNGPDSPFKARGRPGLASHWPPQPRPVVLCASRSAPAWFAFRGSARRAKRRGKMSIESFLRRSVLEVRDSSIQRWLKNAPKINRCSRSSRISFAAKKPWSISSCRIPTREKSFINTDSRRADRRHT